MYFTKEHEEKYVNEHWCLVCVDWNDEKMIPKCEKCLEYEELTGKKLFWKCDPQYNDFSQCELPE
jgi:hypothetical protein